MKLKWLYNVTIILCINHAFIGLTHAQLAQDWWFDVEIILFKRDLDVQIDEDFSNAIEALEITAQRDLISLPLLRQTDSLLSIRRSLPMCFTNNQAQERLGTSALFPQLTSLMMPLTLHENMFGTIGNFILPLNNPLPELDTVIASPARSDKSTRFSDEPYGINAQLIPKDGIIRRDDVHTALAKTRLLRPSGLYDGLSLKPLTALFNDVTLNTSIRCIEQITPRLSGPLPKQLTDESEYVNGNERVVASEYLRLSEFADDLFTQRDIQPLLHTVWRQNIVFGESNAEFFALKAGEKLVLPALAQEEQKDDVISIDSFEHGGSFSAVLNALQEDIVNQTTRNWEDNTKEDKPLIDEESINETDDVFEIEGRIKVYLQNINRIPYLHIDSDIMHHQFAINEEGVPEIRSYPFEQRRRIISKQIHYFDHPAFGMIVRLERYDPSTNEDEDAE
ncbi:MAG: CsiV family protein [Pseudomonadota bacterium]